VPLQARAVPTYWCLGVGLAIDGTAVPLQARAVPSFWLFWLFVKAWDGTVVPLQARAVPSFWHFGAQNFFSPFS